MDEGKPEDVSESAKQRAEWDDWFRIEIKQLREDIQSGTDNFDKSMLTLSSGALAVSLAFIKDIVPLGEAVWLNLLMASWIAFALCILITVISFLVSIAALRKHQQFLNKVRNGQGQEFFNRKTFHWTLLRICTYAAASLFVAGLACTMIFVCKNVRNFHMKRPIEKAVITDFLKKGREPMEMMPVPAVPITPATSVPAQTGTPGNAPAAMPATPCQTQTTKE